MVTWQEAIEIAATGDAVGAFLCLLYGEAADITVDVAMELLRLAEAYDLKELVAQVESDSLMFR